MLRNLLLIAAGFVALPGVGMAIGIDVLGGDPCNPVALLSDVQVNGFVDTSGNVCFDLTNLSGGIITSLTFQTTIASGLVDPDMTPGDNDFVADNFTCGNSGGYFKGCDITYDLSKGTLTYTYSGVNPPNGDEACPNQDGDCEQNEHEGIPPSGAFHIQFTGWLGNDMVLDELNGTDAPTNIFVNGVLPTLVNTETVTPEPSTLYSIGLGILLLAGIVEFRRRKALALKRH